MKENESSSAETSDAEIEQRIADDSAPETERQNPDDVPMRATVIARSLLSTIAALADVCIRIGRAPESTENGRVIAALVASRLSPDAPTTAVVDELSDDVRPEIRELYQCLDLARVTVGELASLGDTVYELICSIPASRDEIVIQLVAAQHAYETASSRVSVAAIAWANESLQGPRIKAGIVAALVASGTARTPAEKQASESDEYRKHRDRLNELAQVKADREYDRTLAYTRLETTRQVCETIERQLRAEEERRMNIERVGAAENLLHHLNQLHEITKGNASPSPTESTESTESTDDGRATITDVTTKIADGAISGAPE